MCLIALMAPTLAAKADYISGSVNFSSAAGAGIILKDSAENLTTNLGAAEGIMDWTFSEVEQGSGSFDIVPDGTTVSFLQPWLFDSPFSVGPLWTIAGPQAFTFNLTSSTTVYQSPDFLAVRGTGVLTGNGYQDTPAEWWFTTQGAAADKKFSWSSATISVPDGGSTVILLGGSLFGLFGLRRAFMGRVHLASNADS